MNAQPITRLALFLVFLCVASVPLVAQEKKTKATQWDAKLERLLEELREVPPEVWKARLTRLDEAAAKHEAAEKRLRQKAEILLARAREQKRLAELARKAGHRDRQLLALVGPPKGKSSSALARKSAPAKPRSAAVTSKKAAPKKAMAKAAPKKRAPKKAMAKAAPKKSAPKKAMAKAAPKKSAPKKAVAKAAPKKSAPKKAVAKAAPKKSAPKKAMAKADTPAAPKRKLSNFVDHVQPIFEEHCSACHHADDASGGLDLSSYAALMKGGGSGDVIAAGDSEKSRLYRLVSHQEQPSMPPDQGPIDQKKIDAIQQWIDDGALRNSAAASAAAKKLPAPKEEKEEIEPAMEVAAVASPPLPAEACTEAPTHGRFPVMIKALALSPAAPLIAVPGQREILLHHRDSRELLAILPFPFHSLEVLRFSADGETLLAAGGNPGKKGRVVLYDVRSGKERGQFGREYDSVLAAALSPKGTLVALGGASKVVRVFEVASGELLYQIKKHSDWILSIDFSPDGNWLATADRAGGLFTWEADTGRDLNELRGHQGAVHAVRFRPDAKELATVGDDGSLRLWDFNAGRQLRRTRAHSGKALSVAWAKDRRLVTGGSDGRVKLWNSSGRGLTTLPSLGEWVFSVALAKNDVFAGPWDGRLRIFDAKSRKERKGLITP